MGGGLVGGHATGPDGGLLVERGLLVAQAGGRRSGLGWGAGGAGGT